MVSQAHDGAPDKHQRSTYWPLPGGSSTVRSLLAGGSGKLSGKPLVVLKGPLGNTTVS